MGLCGDPGLVDTVLSEADTRGSGAATPVGPLFRLSLPGYVAFCDVPGPAVVALCSRWRDSAILTRSGSHVPRGIRVAGRCKDEFSMPFREGISSCQSPIHLPDHLTCFILPQAGRSLEDRHCGNLVFG